MALVIRALGGLLLWSVGFSLLYGVHGIGCELGWGGRDTLGPFTALNLVLISLWLVLLVGAAWLSLRATRAYGGERDTVSSRTQLVCAWAGLVGLFFTGAPVLLPAQCL